MRDRSGPGVLYRLLLRLLPSDLRRDYEEDMARHFADLRRDESATLWRRARLMGIAIWDVLSESVVARARAAARVRRRTKREGGVGMLETARQDIRFAVRGMAKNPGVTFTMLATLAIGVGANVAMFGVVRQTLLGPLPVEQDARVVRIYEHRPRADRLRNVVSYPDFADWRERNESFSGLAGWTGYAAQLTGADEPAQVTGVAVTWNFFDVTGGTMTVGRSFERSDVASDGEPVVVLSSAVWRERFGGDPAVIGRRVELHGNSAAVIGVAERASRFPAWAEFWVPLTDNPYDYGRGGHWLSVIGRLRPGVTLELARDDLSRIALQIEEENPRSNAGHYVSVFPLRAEEVGDVGRGLLLLMAAVGFVLLIACANLGGIWLARSAARGRELAIRASIGASRRRLVRQLLTETAVLVAVGSALGLALASIGLRALDLPELLGIGWVGAPPLDLGMIAFTVAAGLLTAALAGGLPALRATGSDPVRTLREGGGGSTGGLRALRARHALVTVEVALTVVLLIGAGLAGRSLLSLSSVDPGFVPGGVIAATVQLPPARFPEMADRGAALESILQEATRLPGVASAGMTNAAPLTGADAGRFFRIVGRPEPESGDDMNAHLRVITPGYLDAMGIPVLRGRDLSPSDRVGSERVMLVNRAMADRFWPGEDPLGARVHTVYMGVDTFTVVGVVGNVRHRKLDVDPAPEIYLSALQTPPATLTLVARTRSGSAEIATELKEAVRRADPNQPLGDLRSMEELLLASLSGPRVVLRLIGAFGGFALVLAVLGIYGVVSYSVRLRTGEIGLRMALGARRIDVLRNVLRASGAPIALGLAVGVGAALWMSKVAEGLIFGVSPADPITYASVAALLLLTGLAAVWLPARSAMQVEPAASLRSEQGNRLVDNGFSIREIQSLSSTTCRARASGSRAHSVSGAIVKQPVITREAGAARRRDWAAVLPAACAVHCTLTPVLASIFPLFASWHGVERIVLALAVVLAVVSLAVTWGSHRRAVVLLLAGVGVVIWWASLEGVLLPAPEAITSPIGGFLLAGSLLLNGRYRHEAACDECGCAMHPDL